jgi:hypothetical protein
LPPQLLLLDVFPRDLSFGPGESLGALSVPPAVARGDEVGHTAAFEEGGIVDVGVKEFAEPSHFLEASTNDCCLEKREEEGRKRGKDK